MGGLKSLQGEHQPANIPHLLENLSVLPVDELPGHLKNDFGSLGVVKHQQVHNSTEHFVAYAFGSILHKPQMQCQHLHQQGRRVSYLGHHFIYLHQELFLKPSSQLHWLGEKS